MTFEKRLDQRAAEIEGHLAAVLAESAGAAADAPDRLAAAMRHAVMGGGKRLRPFLVIETAVIFGVQHEANALPAAAAVELIHCYSLVHDDLPAMDNDRLRRGKPTVWTAFDEWTAILTGDALLTLAFEQLATGSASGVSEGRRLSLIAGLAKAAGAAGMAGGQMLDLEADKLGQPPRPTAGHIARLQAMKTGALFRFACEAGAIVGDAEPSHVAAMARFGDKLGAAFQLADDLLDVEGDAAVLGKATAKDAAAGKATLIGLEGVAAARARLTQIEAEGLEAIAAFGARADVLRETLNFACCRKK